MLCTVARRRCLSALVWSVVGTGCTPAGFGPVLEQVEPGWGYSGADTRIEVDGRLFLPRVEADGVRDVSVDNRFVLVLDTTPPTPLEDVERLSDSLLTATVPAGLDPGRYGLHITAPSGASDRLDDAFVVTSTRASTVGLSIPEVRLDVGEYALAQLQLRDLSGGDVPAPIDIEVRAIAKSGDPSAVRFQEGLQDQAVVAPGTIRGSLDSGGGAAVYFTSTGVDDVALEVRGIGLNEHIAVLGPEVRFEPASLKGIEVTPGTDPFVAGVPGEVTLRLIDADGNTTRGELLVATIQETCTPRSSGYVDVVTISDQITLRDVVLTGATVDGGCPDNHLRVVGSAGTEVIVGESEPLDVQAGALARYEVEPVSEAVLAGTEVQNLLIRAVDTWGNPIVDHEAPIALYDNLGGLDPESNIGSASCGAFVRGQTLCATTLERAGDSVTITAESPSGVSGTSRDFRVLAGPVSQLEVSLPDATYEAGETIRVMTLASDALGNPSSFADSGGASALQLTDSTGTLACAARFAGPTPGLHYSLCSITRSDPEVVVTGEIAVLGVVGSAPPVEVINGPLDHIDVALDRIELTAGDPLRYELAAFDAFDNPFRVPSGTGVVVSDRDGGLTPTTVILDSAGEGTGTHNPVHAAAANVLLTTVASSTVGVSEPFAVAAAEPSSFLVETDATWVTAAADVPLTITAVDIYGNPNDTVESVLQLEAVTGAATGLAGVEMTDGLATATMTWGEPTLQETVRAFDTELSGTSDPFDVVDLDCPGGPTADLVVASETDLRLCLVAGQTSEVTISADESAEGDAPIEAWHLHTGGGTWSRDNQSSWTERWSGAGVRTLSVTVVDADACADTATARVWVGESNGEPVGPVEVTADDTVLTAGSATFGSTTVRFRALDCTGDPSSSGTLYVRADLGALSSGGSSCIPTGAGLSVPLDSAGEGSITWSVAADDVAALASVHAGVPSGAAWGRVQASVSGDARPPIVVDFSPRGASTGSSSAIALSFSEPLLASSVTTSAFSLTDPSGDTVTIASASLSSDGTTVEVEPSVPIDGSSGVWSFEAASSLRDDAGGNFLAGDWITAPTGFALSIGDVAETAPDVTGCTPNRTAFRPDGDDGLGIEADTVQVGAVAGATPEWWWLEVADPDGTVVHWQPIPATSASQNLSWDGRGIDGPVLPTGTYQLHLSALDGVLSEGAPCITEVRIDHPIDQPESP